MAGGLVRSVYDRLVPGSAIAWGCLTVEPLTWHMEMLHRSWALTQRDIGRAFEPVLERMVGVVSDIVAAGVTEPSAMRDDGSQRFRDRDGRCRPCIRFREEHGFDRPALIIQRKAEGRKLSKQEADQAIARARREHELEQRKAAQREARRLAASEEREPDEGRAFLDSTDDGA